MRELIRKYTDLTESDILILERTAEMIQPFAELADNDIFLNCFDRSDEFAVVVAHGNPVTKQSLYKDSVIGKIALPENEPSLFMCKKNGVPIRDSKGITQENKIVVQKVIPIKNDSNTIIAVLTEEQDVTDSLDKEEIIKNISEETKSHSPIDFPNMSNHAADYVRDGIIIIDQGLRIAYINPEAQKIYNKLGHIGDLAGLPFSAALFTHKEAADRILKGEITSIEIEQNDNSYLIKFEGAVNHATNGLFMIIEDLSDIKNKEREIVYKDAAVREMHHRIKNNLQIIISILNLQIIRSQCEETKKALLDNVMRINSISIIHEALMTSDFNQDHSLKELLSNIIVGTQGYINLEDRHIEIKITGDDIMIPADKGMAIVMVTNELITNSLKHAFNNSTSGVIEIVIQKGSLYTTLIVKDNGKGFISNGDTKRKNLGFTIVQSMIKEKLKGNIKINSTENGTVVSFDFRTDSM